MVQMLLKAALVAFAMVATVACGQSNVPGPAVTPSATTPTPSSNGPTTQELKLEISSLTSPVRRGEAATLTIATASTATAQVRIYYPGRTDPVVLDEQQVGPGGEASWTWIVDPGAKPGTGRVVVTASVIGRSLQTEQTFTVE